jgi:hypothetical protein
LVKLAARVPVGGGGIVVVDPDGSCSWRGLIYSNADAVPCGHLGHLVLPRPAATLAEWEALRDGPSFANMWAGLSAKSGNFDQSVPGVPGEQAKRRA